MGKKKIIFDLIHGYIKITNDIENIINDETFQRLKFINQLTAQHLYPSANHTRFEHSLGVMKLAIDFFEKIENELRIKIKNELRIKIKNNYRDLNNGGIDKRIKFLKRSLLFASLLHDVGHPPLSHVGENLYDKNEITDNIKKISSEKKIEVEDESILNSSAHELMTCFLIISNFKEKLDVVIKNIDYNFLFRIITGNKYADSVKYWDKNIIISILNSETIDADKLDYLMRDNFMTGFVGPQIDIERLIESLTITENKEISFKPIGLSAIQKVIECKDSLYMWVCNHHTVVYTDFLYTECFKHFINLYNRELEYKEKIPRDELFSCDAIANKNVTDNEALYFIKRSKNLSKNNETSKYTNKLVSQLVDRKFLKPTWKTLYEYTSFIKDNFDDQEKEEVIDKIKNNENIRRNIVNKIILKTGIEKGDIFLIVRPNIFYCSKLSKFYIYYNGKQTELKKLLPQRNFIDIYEDIAFYLYCKKEKIEIVKNTFVEIMKKREYIMNE